MISSYTIVNIHFSISSGGSTLGITVLEHKQVQYVCITHYSIQMDYCSANISIISEDITVA